MAAARKRRKSLPNSTSPTTPARSRLRFLLYDNNNGFESDSDDDEGEEYDCMESPPAPRPRRHSLTSANSYRPLPTPLSSHPALKHTNTATSSHTGALSALSTILLGQSAQHVTGSKSSRSSLLSRRRGKQVEEQFNLSDNHFFNTDRKGKGKEQDSEEEAADALAVDDEFLSLDEEIGRLKRGKAFRAQPVAEGDMPPSPVGLPGGWVWEAGDRHPRDGALLLPPPFLDKGSSRDSFAGVLGTRNAHLASQRAKRAARMYAKDRPPPPKFPQSLLVTANKLLTALGPPSGLDSGRPADGADRFSRRIERERRQLERSERSLRGFEFGKKVAERVKERLRSEEARNGRIHVVRPSTVLDVGGDKSEPVSEIKRATPMTPMSFISPSLPPISVEDLLPLASPPLPSVSPLFSFPTSSSSATETPLESPEVTPLKPSLVPVMDAVDPSPLPLSPFEKQQLSSSPVEDEGYFSLRRRNSRKKGKFGNGALSAVLDPVDEQDTPSEGISPLHPATPLSPHPSSLSGPAPLFVRLGVPLGSALRSIENRARANLDFISWALVGDYSDGGDTVKGVLGVVLHVVGFGFFVGVHVWSLVLSTYASLITTFYFSKWIYLNLTGKTDLSIVVKEYFVLCKHQWTLDKSQEPMSIWSVLLAFVEMALIQSMTRERWLVDGPGKLKLLNGEDAMKGMAAQLSPLQRARSTKRRDSGEHRPGIGRRRTTMGWTEDDGDGESLLVTGGDDSILEGTILNTKSTPRFRPDLDDLDDDDELPPLDIGDSLPGFSFTPAAHTPHLDPNAFVTSPLPMSSSSELSPPLLPVPDAARDSDEPLKKLLKNIKRHVRLATASYGLHSYILAPPSPLFTPSGTTLPHGVFAHLGGVAHTDVLHVAIQKQYTGMPQSPGLKGEDDDEEEDSYTPQFYLLRDDLNAEVVCVVRGTQSLADIVVDIQANLRDVSLPSISGDGSLDSYKMHAGFLEAAERLLDEKFSPLWGKLKTVLEDHPGYSLVFTGHSLGAAIASTLALLIGKFTPSSPGSTRGTWTTNDICGLPGGRICQAICFAHPTTVDVPLSERCALGDEPLVLSLSLGSDLVVRMGLPQVRETRAALGRIADRRRKLFKRRQEGEHGITGVIKTWWRWKRLGGGTGAKAAEVLEFERRAWVWREEMDGICERASMMIPAGKTYHVDRLPPALEEKRKKEMRLAMLEDDMDGEDPAVFGLYEVGDPAAFYACPHLEADLVTSHLPRVYLDAIEGL